MSRGIVLLAVGASVCVVGEISFGARFGGNYLVNVRAEYIRGVLCECFSCIGTRKINPPALSYYPPLSARIE